MRGFQPWPNAHSILRSRRVIIWKAVANELIPAPLGTGTIIKAAGDNLVIAAGNATALEILELQLEGSRRMTARDFINGMHAKVGQRLG